MARCLSNGEVVDAHEVNIQRFDDTLGVLLASCAPIFGADGGIAGAVSVFSDITRSKDMEAALRLAHADTEILYRLTGAVAQAETIEQIYEHALDAAAGALRAERGSILLFDDGKVMRFRAWRGLSVEYRQAVDGHSPWSPEAIEPAPILVSDVEVDPAMESYRAIFHAEGIRALAFFPLVHQRRLLGKFMVYFGTSRLFSERDVRLALAIGSHVAQGVVRRTADVEIVRLLEQATVAQQAAEQAVRARDELLAIVSHDLRNPVNTLSLSTASLMKLASDQKNEVLHLQAQRLRRSLSTIDRLIGDLLDVGAIDSGMFEIHPRVADLGSILDSALDQLRPLASERQQDLKVEVPAGVQVLADPERIVQVLSNLVGNAVKFTPVNGTILIRSQVTTTDGKNCVEVAVIDSGPGISVEHLPRIFDRFWQPKQQRRGGVGLGLAIAKGVVAAHGGRISAESPPGAGAIFRFTLPIA